MIRFLIQYLLPLLAPLAVYVLWLWYSQGRARKSGNAPPAFTRGGFFWSILIGAVMLVISLAVLAVTGGVEPDSGVYQAPYLKDGEIVGPRYEPAE
jgi:hypothetical protein